MEEIKKRKNRESWIDQQIRKAQAEGKFDNLPGKGQPVDLTPNPYAIEQELGFKILRDAGFAPEWIEVDKDIRKKLDTARESLARSWAWRQSRESELAGQADGWSEAERDRIALAWQSAVARYGEEIADINDDIADLNLKVPSPQFQRFKIDAAREVEKLEGPQ